MQLNDRVDDLAKRVTRARGDGEAHRAARRPHRETGAREAKRARQHVAQDRPKKALARAAPGHDLERRRRRADLLALDLDRQRARRRPPRRAGSAAPRPSGAHVPALVDLRRRRQEVELRHVADQHDVEEPSSGARVRREHHPAAVPDAVRDDHVVHAAPPLPVVEPHGHLGVLPREEDARERVEEGRLAAERLRHPVRALRHRAAHADRADVREEALLARRPTCESVTRPASIVRTCRRRARRGRRRRSAVGIP